MTLQSGDNSIVDSPVVLIVDDDPFMRQSLREAMTVAGWRVETVCGGKEALCAFQHLRPDLVILDLVMPEVSGFETCAELRKLEGGRHTPILGLTGLQDTESIHQAFEAGATDFISKPIKSEILDYRTRYLLRAGRSIEDLARSEANLQLLRAAVESLPIGITISNANGGIIYTNPAEAMMHGFDVGELLQHDAKMLAPQRLHRTKAPERLENCGIWRRESVNRRKSGEEFQVQLSSVSVRSPRGEFLGIVTACEDITERKKNEEKIRHLAYYDNITALPNRTLFLDRLQRALALAERTEEKIAILFLDLDNFKDINDTQGHDFGDKLLKEVALRISGCTRNADTLARLGGDEFVILLTGDGKETAALTANRILETMGAPFEVEGRLIYAGASIGIALFPEDATDVEGLLRSADSAMYQAKTRGRRNFQFFSARINAQIKEKVALETDLRQAIEHKDLTLLYQPQWDLETGRHCGVEVLLRWRHPELGEISPTQFIPLAEGSGQILRLGEWVLRSACAQTHAWVQAGFPVRRVAVNVSVHQLRRGDFPELIERILADINLDPSHLDLEFTESALMDHTEKTISVLKALKRLGVHLSIDDFGTGYSSLNYLKYFPIDQIKIDRTFIAGLGRDKGDTAIVSAIIALAHNLNIGVLAEGVETLEQLSFLREHGCVEVQGFLLGNPMLPEKIKWLDVIPESFRRDHF